MKTHFQIRKLMKTSAFRLVTILIVVIIPLNILTLILSGTTVNEVQNQISQETQSALEMYVGQMDDAMARAATKIHVMARDNVNFGRLNSKEITDKDEYYRQLQATVNLQNDFDDVMTDNSWITGIFAFFPEKEIPILRCNANIQSSLGEYIESEIAAGQVGAVGAWKTVEVDGNAILLIMSHYKNAYYGAWIDLKEMANTLDMNSSDQDIVKAFTDETGKVLFSNTEDLQQLDFEDPSRMYNGINYVLVEAKSQTSNLCMVQILSKDQITNALPWMIRILQISSVVALLILPVIMFSMKKWMINPLNKLSRAMEKIEAGNMDVRIKEGATGSEFEQINRNFNNMMDEVSKLKIDVYEETLEKQQIKMQFLSQQIQPHFILNAMNILYNYEPEEYPLIQKMILGLSQYFRYIVNANTDFVELSQEMDHIRNYFEIQQVRYPDTFFAMVEYDEEVGDCLVPPLLIQNFAENAIKHSITLGNTIDIFVIAQKMEGDRVRIRLSDTGEGMSDELIEKVEIFRKTRKKQEGLGIGIQNAIERLDILYEGKTLFKISKENPHGTRVEIIVPVFREHGEERRRLEDL